MRSFKKALTMAVIAALFVLALGSTAQAKGAPAVDRITLKAQQLLEEGYMSFPKKKVKTSPTEIVLAPRPNSHEARVNRELVKLTLGEKVAPSPAKKANEYAGLMQTAIMDVEISKGQPVEGRYVHPNPPIKGEVFAKAYHEMCVKLYGPLVVGGNTNPDRPMFSRKAEEYIQKYSKIYNVPAKLIREVMKRESGGQHYRRDGRIVTSPKGALGRMQLMPGTAAMLGVNPYDEEDNIKGGVKYLRLGLNKYGNNVFLAAAFYIGGPGYAAKVAKRGIGQNSEEGRYIHGIARSVGSVAGEPQFASLRN